MTAKFISIMSMRPDTGNTTVALNLGMALHDLGHRALVVDTDFSHANILDHLYSHHEKSLPLDLNAVLDDETHITDAVMTHPSRLQVLATPAMRYPENGWKLHVLLDDLSHKYDFIILDTSRDSDALIDSLKNSDEAFIVHTPGYTSREVKRAQELLSDYKVSNLGVILNRAHEGSVNSIFGSPVIAKFPRDRKIMDSFSRKHPAVYAYPSSKASKKFLHIAERLVP